MFNLSKYSYFLNFWCEMWAHEKDPIQKNVKEPKELNTLIFLSFFYRAYVSSNMNILNEIDIDEIKEMPEDDPRLKEYTRKLFLPYYFDDQEKVDAMLNKYLKDHNNHIGLINAIKKEFIKYDRLP
jgi:hypothetical protein